MAKIFFELFVALLVGLALITQVIIPTFSKTPFFWFFRRNPYTGESSGVNSLDELSKEADEVMEKVTNTKQKISSAEQTLNQIKSKTQ